MSIKVGLEEKDSSEESYRGLLGQLMQDKSQPMVDAYGAVESLLSNVNVYVNVRVLPFSVDWMIIYKYVFL